MFQVAGNSTNWSNKVVGQQNLSAAFYRSVGSIGCFSLSCLPIHPVQTMTDMLREEACPDSRENHIGTNLSESSWNIFSIGTRKVTDLMQNTSQMSEVHREKKFCSLPGNNRCSEHTNGVPLLIVYPTQKGIESSPPRRLNLSVEKSPTITRLHSSTMQQHNFGQQTSFNIGH